MNRILMVAMTIMLGMANGWAVGPERNYASPSFPIYENEFSKSLKEDTPVPHSILKIVSFNIEFSKDLEKVVHQLKYNHRIKTAQIILIQEVVGKPGEPHQHAAEYIAKELGMNYAYAPAFVHQKNELDFGVAILSRYPLRDVTKIILPHLHFQYKTQRIALGATIHIGGKDLRVYSAHLETLQLADQRIDQMKAIIEDTKLHKTEHFVIGGDLNTAPFWHRSKLLKYIKQMDFRDATKGIGVTMKKILGIIRFKLDHIFTKGMWIIGKGKTDFSNASDHRPIWIVTRIKDRPEF